MNQEVMPARADTCAAPPLQPGPLHCAEPPAAGPRVGGLAAVAAVVALTQAGCGAGEADGAVDAAATAHARTGAAKAAAADGATPAMSEEAADDGDSHAKALASGAKAAPSREQAARFLLRAQFSASDAEIDALRAAGYAGWLGAQFSAPASGSAWDWLDARGYGQIDANRYYNASYPADHAVWHQLLTAPDQLRQRAALALSEFFVVSTNGLSNRWRGQMVAAWWDLLCAHAFGNFRALLEAVTLNAAMGSYLNLRGSQKENPATGRLPDENYAREVMQLMTIGLYELNADGSEKTHDSGEKRESYTQSDVTNLARVLTGWDFDQSLNAATPEPGSGTAIGNSAFARLPMVPNAARHSTLAATFLGVTVPAGTDARAALKTALDTLFNHPNVAPFFARQMIQRLVAGNPSRAYVARVAAKFDDNGRGVRGDLRAVWTAVLCDPEAIAAPNDASGKLREPMLRFVQWGRTFGLHSLHGSWKLGDTSDPATKLGQSPLRAPSVFNFFRPGYVPPSTALARSQGTAPEFQLVTESSVGGYLNYMQGVIRRGVYVNAPDQPNPGSNASNGYDIVPDYTAELALCGDAAALVAHLNLRLAAGQLSAATSTLMANALDAQPITEKSSSNAKLDRVAAAVLMVMCCPEYLIQK